MSYWPTRARADSIGELSAPSTASGAEQNTTEAVSDARMTKPKPLRTSTRLRMRSAWHRHDAAADDGVSSRTPSCNSRVPIVVHEHHHRPRRKCTSCRKNDRATASRPQWVLRTFNVRGKACFMPWNREQRSRPTSSSFQSLRLLRTISRSPCTALIGSVCTKADATRLLLPAMKLPLTGSMASDESAMRSGRSA